MAGSTLRAAKAAAALTPEIVEIFGAPPLCGDDCDPMLREQADPRRRAACDTAHLNSKVE